MTDPASLAALTGSGLLAIGLASAALLKAWHGWLELRRVELAARGGPRRPGGAARGFGASRAGAAPRGDRERRRGLSPSPSFRGRGGAQAKLGR